MQTNNPNNPNNYDISNNPDFTSIHMVTTLCDTPTATLQLLLLLNIEFPSPPMNLGSSLGSPYIQHTP